MPFILYSLLTFCVVLTVNVVNEGALAVRNPTELHTLVAGFTDLKHANPQVLARLHDSCEHRN